MQNCLELDSSNPLKCGLCESNHILTSYSCPTGSCVTGCLHCSTTKCLICDKNYSESSVTASQCVKISVDSTNSLTNCLYHDLRTIGTKKCYKCDDSYNVSNDGLTCVQPSSGYEVKLLGCRIFSDSNRNKCQECLPQYKANTSNTECTVLNFFLL